MIDDLALEELSRRMGRIVQCGIVSEVNYATARARVSLGTLVTGWLPWCAGRAGGDTTWAPVEAGEHVLVLSPAGDAAQGIIVASLYRAARPPNGDRADLRRITFADGTVCEYDRAAHRYTLQLPAAGAEVRILCAGKVTVVADGDITVESGGQIDIEAQGNVNIRGANINLN